jgi:hypothetical protein
MDRSELDGETTTTRAPVTPLREAIETKTARAVRISLARAFPVRTSTAREALVRGSITMPTRR